MNSTERGGTRCSRSVVILHCSPDFLENSGVKIDFDGGSKSKLIPSPLNSVCKTKWTVILEGIVDYCRIVFDVFPDDKKVAVKACVTRDDIRTINDFSDEGQTILELMKGFTRLGLPPENSGGTAALLSGLKSSLELLTNPTPRDKTEQQDAESTSFRIMIVTTFESSVADSVIAMIKDTTWTTLEQLNMLEQGSRTINIACVNITSDHVKKTEEVFEIAPSVSLTMYFYKPQSISDKLLGLAKLHYNLKSTTITGIPMKEEQHAGSSANYDVELIHPAEAHHEIDKLSASSSNAVPVAGKQRDATTKNLVVLKWCTPKSNASADLQPCVATFRVTPADVSSRPAACLISFLLQGRNVSLEQPRKSGSKLISHMLASHGGDVFMHVLLPGRSPLEDPPSISEGSGGRVTDYRIGDFGEFMKENRLAPYPDQEVSNLSDRPNSKGLDKLERSTRHWPMVISETVIYNMAKHLEPLLSVMVKAKINDDEVHSCKRVIYRLQAMESRNDTLPLPIISLRGKGNRREDQYRQLWSELDTFLELASKTSSTHRKVLECLRGTLDVKVSPNDDADKDAVMSEGNSSNSKNPVEQMTWKEVESFGLTTEFEKKPPPPVAKVPLTDPRRRSAKKKEEDEPSPVKRSNIAKTEDRVTGASSLLALYQSRLAAAGRPSAGDFEGRKNAVKGKTELYPDLHRETTATKS